MKRSAVLGLALLGMLRLPAWAQQVGKTYRVGILSGRTPAYDRPALDAFRRTLSGLGYQEGKNLEIVYRGADADMKRLPELAAELVRAKPDAILANGTPMIAAAHRATRSVPIVMTNSTDPVAAGFVASLARPGGNITGTTNIEAEVESKRLQLLKELVPRLERVAVISNPDNPGSLAVWREAERVARTIGMAAVPVRVRFSDELDAVFDNLPQLHAGAIMVSNDPVMLDNAARVVQFALTQRLPAIYSSDAFPAAGGLMFYGTPNVAVWIQAATYVDRILKGAKPADLPVERPTTIELFVNLKAARDIGITVPQSILLRADQVIR